MFEEFKNLMKEKFIKNSETHGDSWRTRPINILREYLKHHVDKWDENLAIEYKEKEDLIDIANYCCFIWKRLENARK